MGNRFQFSGERERVMTLTVVDVREYVNFQFVGAGAYNIVIGAERKCDGRRIVWRTAKGEKCEITGQSVDTLHNLVRFKTEVIAPFIEDKYLLPTAISLFKIEEFKNVAKVVSLKTNTFVPSYQDLCKLGNDLSPLVIPSSDGEYISVIEMDNAIEYIEEAGRLSTSSVITIELKPKGPFARDDLPYCEICLFYLWKKRTGHLKHYSECCCLRLNSGNEEVMRRELKHLFKQPGSQLKLFQNGRIVFSDQIGRSQNDLETIVEESIDINFEDFLTAILFVLTGSRSLSNFQIQQDSILDQMHRFQKVDKVGIRNLVPLLQTFPKDVQTEILKESPLENLDFLDGTNLRSLVDACRVAITAEDFSIILNLQNIEHFVKSFDTVCLPSGQSLSFSMHLADYDPYTAKYLISRYEGVNESIEEIDRLPDGHQMKQCV